jgi:hypothetical protein
LDPHHEEVAMNKLTGFLAVSLLSFTAISFGQQNNEIVTPAKDVKVTALTLAQPKAGTDGAKTNYTYIDYAGYELNGWAYVGSSAYQQLTVDVSGLNFAYSNRYSGYAYSHPSSIVCQLRQYDNYEYYYPDIFGCQVIETYYSYADYSDHIRFRIRRLDLASGWGQNLRLDFVVFENSNY